MTSSLRAFIALAQQRALFAGSDKQLAQLMADALRAVNPDTDTAARDAALMAGVLEDIAEELAGDSDYHEDENDG